MALLNRPVLEPGREPLRAPQPLGSLTALGRMALDRPRVDRGRCPRRASGPIGRSGRSGRCSLGSLPPRGPKPLPHDRSGRSNVGSLPQIRGTLPQSVGAWGRCAWDRCCRSRCSRGCCNRGCCSRGLISRSPPDSCCGRGRGRSSGVAMHRSQPNITPPLLLLAMLPCASDCHSQVHEECPIKNTMPQRAGTCNNDKDNDNNQSSNISSSNRSNHSSQSNNRTSNMYSGTGK